MSADEVSKEQALFGADPSEAVGGLSPDAVIIEGVAHNGKPCRIIDNTGQVPRAELQSLLDALIEQKRFGLTGLSTAGGNTIRLGAPEFTHMQIGEDLYRFILFPYEARLDAF